jgi:hypothetical protein
VNRPYCIDSPANEMVEGGRMIPYGSVLRRALRFAGPFCASTSVFMLGHKSNLADTIHTIGFGCDGDGQTMPSLHGSGGTSND